MDKQWKKVPLAAVIGAILAAPAIANDHFEVKAGGVQLSADNYVDVEFNDLDGENTLNSSVINGDAFGGASGIIHSNVAAGFFNQGSNQAALGAREAGSPDSMATVDAKSAQGSDGENIAGRFDVGGDGDSTSEISGDAFVGASGIIGANAASGIANLQTNNVALGNAEDASELHVTASSSQQLGGLEREGTAPEGNMILNQGIDNVSKLSGSLDTVSGVTGVNVAAGTVNQQANSVALANYVGTNADDPTDDASPVTLGAAGDSVPNPGTNNAGALEDVTETSTTYVKAQGQQTVTQNQIDIDGAPVPSQDNSADIVDALNDGASGIVGANVVAGDANAQSNNVSLANVALGEASNTDSASVESSSTQSVASNNVSHTNNGDGVVPANDVGDNGANITNSGNSFNGIAGANVAAGQANAQTNNVAVALVEPNGNGPVNSLTTSASATQSVTGNTLTQNTDSTKGQSINDASISGSFVGASGVVGANAAAGQFNAQSNQVALSNVDGYIDNQAPDAGHVSASSTQTVSGNALSNPASEGEGLAANSNAVLTGNAFNDVTGIVGANIAAGQANAQSNNVAISNVTGDADSSDLLANSEQTISLNNNPQQDDHAKSVQRTSQASIESNFDSNVAGVVGVNVGSGQANAQSNNAAIAQYRQLNGENSILSTASSMQTIGDDNAQLASPSGMIDNDATINNSFTEGASGVVGVNVAAGQANAQSNNVSLAAYEAGNAENEVSTVASSTQNTQNNSVGVVTDETLTTWPIDNDATITSSFNGPVSGVVGVSVAAGQNNAQANNAAIAVRDGDDDGNGSGSALASSVQNVVNNSIMSDNAESTTNTDPEAAYAISNNALINPSFDQVSGIAGVNVGSGQANVQANNVAMTNSAVGTGSQGGSDINDNVATVSTNGIAGTVAFNKQEIDGSQIELAGDGVINGIDSPAENTAKVMGSFGSTTGVVGVNVAAGQSNAQSNNVAISADTSAGDVDGTAVTAAVSLQEFDQVDATLGAGFENEATLSGSFNQGTNGIVGANVVAGQANAQTNNVALSSSDSDTSAVLAANAQVIGAQLNNGGNNDTGTDHPMLVINNSFDNTAELTDSFNGAKGILGVNIASGQLNGQANNVAVSVSDSSDTQTGTLNVQTSVINEVQYFAEGAYTATLGDGVFNGAQGVIGTNVAVGVANAQSNNVSIQVTDANTEGLVLAGSVQGNFANGVKGTETGTVSLAGFDDLSVENAQLATFVVANDTDISNSQIQTVGNYSSITGGYNGASGIIGVNVATGMGNLQSNNVTLVASK